jgi:hypothetical protein
VRLTDDVQPVIYESEDYYAYKVEKQERNSGKQMFIGFKLVTKKHRRSLYGVTLDFLGSLEAVANDILQGGKLSSHFMGFETFQNHLTLAVFTETDLKFDKVKFSEL